MYCALQQIAWVQVQFNKAYNRYHFVVYKEEKDIYVHGYHQEAQQPKKYKWLHQYMCCIAFKQ
jgi:hypothetical protein